MNRPLKIKQWHPSQPKRKTKPSTTTKNHEPRRVIASGSARPTLYDDGNPPIADWGEFADFNPYEELRSIEDIIDEAMRCSASGIARDSISMPNPVPIAPVFPRDTTCQTISNTFSLNDEGVYSATEIMTLPADIQPSRPVFNASPRYTTTSTTIPGAPPGPHADANHTGKMPTSFQGRRCHAHLTSQAPPRPPMLEDEKDVESPDSISTSYESIWTPPGVAYKTGHSGATVPIATYAQSTASPPVQSCTIFMTGTQLCSIDHTDSSDGQLSGSLLAASTPYDACEPDLVDVGPRLQGPANVSSASFVAHPEVDDIISEVSITLESDRLTTTPGPIPSPSPQSPPLPAAVKARHHSCDESLHGIRHGSHSASRDASLQYSPQIEQGRELTSATYDNKVEGGPSPPPLHAHDAPSPYLVPAGRRRSRRIAAHRKAYYGDESDNDMDVDYVDSHDDKISLATGVEGGGEGVSDEDEQPACKRRKSSMSSAKKIGSEAARVRRSHRAASPSRVIRRSTNGREQMRTAGVASSASSEAASSETDLATILARCREWPLENVLLKCTTDDGNPIFQLQFNLPPRILGECTSYFASSRLESPSARVVSKARRIPSARLRYTPSEDDLLLQLKAEEKLPWPEIHQRFCEKFPGRPIPSLQVHYSTKVKPRERS